MKGTDHAAQPARRIKAQTVASAFLIVTAPASAPVQESHCAARAFFLPLQALHLQKTA